MPTLPQLTTTLQTLLTTTAETAAHTTQFVQRRSKLTGAAFLQTLVFGWLSNPQATLEALAQTAATVGVDITPQGFDARFTDRAAACVQQVLHAATQQVIAAAPVAIPVLRRFSAVLIQDTTTIALPDALAPLWSGCGGSTPQGTSAALKVGLRFDLLTGQIDRLVCADGRTHDQAVGLQQPHWPTGALRLADLGFFNLGEFRQLSDQGVFWLSRFRAGTSLWDTTGQRYDLVRWLAQQHSERIDLPILLGHARLPARLLAQRVPQEIADQRRARLHATARRKGQAVSAVALALASWTLLLTNVPTEQLSFEEALVLARVRWQIELLFKLWKSHGRLDESRSSNPWRVLCEVYGKLLAMVIQHWLLLTTCWHYPDRSLMKAAQTVQAQALHLAWAIAHRDRVQHVLHIIQRCLAVGCRINKRHHRPHAYQLLLALGDGALT